jgi:sarcosine oxidase subunit beta
MKKNYDAIVIGAGSVGVPTTYFLAKEGYEVLCIDKNFAPGQGQNKAAIGGARATHSDPAKIKICQASLEFFSTWEEKYGTNIGWKKGGYCFPVYGEEDELMLKNILQTQKKFNLKIDWVDADKIKEIIPGINPEGLIGGTFSPDDGQVSPLLTISHVANVSKNLGTTFKFREIVKNLIIKRGKIKGVKTDEREYYSDVVVNASGANASEICKMAGSDISVIPDSHEAGISAPVEKFLDPLVVDLRPGREGKTENFYFGQCHEGQIIFCYTPLVKFEGTDRRQTSEFMPIVARRLVEVIPRLKNIMIRRVWRGLYPMTPDALPIIGKAPNVEGFYLGIGMCGQGFMMGPGAGKNLAKLIATGKPAMDEKIFNTLSPERNFYTSKEEALK